VPGRVSVGKGKRPIIFFVVRTFVRLREMLASNKELARKFNELERRIGTHDQAIASILAAIRELMTPPEAPKKRRMGFIQDDD
jgi:hypothetical protein